MRLSQETHVLRECELLKTLRHPFVVHCAGSFQSPAYLYLVLDFVPGGTLGTRLRGEGRLGASLSPGFKERYLRGATELELVRSGLDDTMREGYQAMRAVWRGRDDVPDLRTAAYLVAIDRVADSYRAMGL